jgi:hypothetical protein
MKGERTRLPLVCTIPLRSLVRGLVTLYTPAEAGQGQPKGGQLVVPHPSKAYGTNKVLNSEPLCENYEDTLKETRLTVT